MTKIVFDAEEHRYFIDNVEYPSVTTITGIVDKSPQLMQWAVNITLEYLKEHQKELDVVSHGKLFYRAKHQHRLVTEKAADIGTRTHRLVEHYLKNEAYKGHLDVRVQEDTAKPFTAFKNWIDEQDFELIDSERIVYSKNLRIAGTTDIVAKVNGKMYLVDLKTSKAIYPDMILQIAAYRKFYQEVTGIDIERLAILRLDKVTGKFEWKNYSDDEYHKGYRSFEHLARFWHNEHN